MAEKKKAKFSNFRSTTAPTDTSRYDCIDGDGEWQLADRNTLYASDRDGWGLKNVIVFVPNGKSKVCAPEPPFYGDGPIDKVLRFCRNCRDSILGK
ncbi:MAG: hypothetical protein WBP41_12265 [Saprospiraceae bacterium]